MNRQGRIPRSRGAISGLLLILLGLWGGLAPFVGPYFHFGFTPDKTWLYNSGRLYYSVIPGAAALLGGLLVVATRSRAIGIIGGLLAALGGAWFGLGQDFTSVVLKRSISVGAPILPAGSSGLVAYPIRTYFETLSFFAGLGFLIVFVGALAIGRFSLLAAQDVAEDASDSYYSSYGASAAASRPDLSQYPSSTGPFQTGAGQYPVGEQYPSSSTFPETPSQFPDAPTQYPDTTTANFPPSDGSG